MATEIRLAFEDSNKIVRLSPSLQLNNHSEDNPAGLTKIAAEGNGVYGLRDNPLQDPFHLAPRDNAEGGVVFFDNNIAKDDFFTLAKILHIKESPKPEYAKRYAAFYGESSNPGQDGYLCQMRLVDRFGLRFHYGAISSSEYDHFPQQDLTQAEAYWAFIENQKQRWGTNFCDSPKLDGKFGGDGDYAREELSFGFMIENSYHQISRIWSRAWLVTK